MTAKLLSFDEALKVSGRQPGDLRAILDLWEMPHENIDPYELEMVLELEHAYEGR